MDVVILPPTLPGELELEAINHQLHMGAVTLDWSQVQAANDAQLRILLAGLDLVEHSDILGLATVPDALAEAMSKIFSRGQALPEYHESSVLDDDQELITGKAKELAEQANELAGPNNRANADQAVPVRAHLGTDGVPWED